MIWGLRAARWDSWRETILLSIFPPSNLSPRQLKNNCKMIPIIHRILLKLITLENPRLLREQRRSRQKKIDIPTFPVLARASHTLEMQIRVASCPLPLPHSGETSLSLEKERQVYPVSVNRLRQDLSRVVKSRLAEASADVGEKEPSQHTNVYAGLPPFLSHV